MARERTTTIRCGEQDCRETRSYAYTSQRGYDEIWQWQKKHPWKCTRHDRPDEVLRPDNVETVTVLVASKVRMSERWRHAADKEFLDGLFWLPEGATGGSGFEYGPGFKAHANDFPEGTRLVVTARVEIPTAEGCEA